MLAKAENPPATGPAHRATFFRQSGWLMIANIAGGALMWAVHFLSKAIPETEYGLFVTLLSVAMCIPTLPLQMVLAHQTAQALATNRQRQLAGLIRLTWLGTFVLWVAGATIVLLLQGHILAHWKISNPASLWITLGIVLLSLWLPIFWGVLQGGQNFLWLGWSMMLNAVGRLTVAVIAVMALSAYAAGLMTGVLVGMILAAGVAAWQTRPFWSPSSLPFEWSKILREVLPLMLGFAAFQFLFSADTMFVRNYFTEDESGFYGAAGTLARALMWLVGPLASVMFPRIVHSAAKSEKNNLMGMVFLGTGLLAVAGAVSLSVLGPWIVRFVFKPSFVHVATQVLPWYAAAMIPLSLANVLLNNLLARSSGRVVVPLCLLAGGYGFALTQFHKSLVMVLQTVGLFNLALLLICAWFTWGNKVQSPEPNPQV
jgi:O-antigen/teichoic acid export membrane protein